METIRLTGNCWWFRVELDVIKSSWWNNLLPSHQHLVRIFKSYPTSEQPILEWLVEGRTEFHLIKVHFFHTRNYRLIIQLNMLYKIFVTILNNRIFWRTRPVWPVTCDLCRDYREALDSIGHRLMICMFESLMDHSYIVRCIKRLLPPWKTRFIISLRKHRQLIASPSCEPSFGATAWDVSTFAARDFHYLLDFAIPKI